jgi:hypothetical protein
VNARRALGVLWTGYALGACQAPGAGVGGGSTATISGPADGAVAHPNAETELAALDTRTPVPLLPMMANHQKRNMREHLVAVEAVTAGIAAGDFAAIERGASHIGFSEQMGAMCTHMGTGAPGFTDRALAFHHTADGIGEAARHHDMQAVLTRLNETLAACTSCHATYKQRVVDEATWAALEKSASPTSMP